SEPAGEEVHFLRLHLTVVVLVGPEKRRLLVFPIRTLRQAGGEGFRLEEFPNGRLARAGDRGDQAVALDEKEAGAAAHRVGVVAVCEVAPALAIKRQLRRGSAIGKLQAARSAAVIDAAGNARAFLPIELELDGAAIVIRVVEARFVLRI